MNMETWLALLRDWARWARGVHWAEARRWDRDAIDFLRLIADVCARRLAEPDCGSLADAIRALARGRRLHGRRQAKKFSEN